MVSINRDVDTTISDGTVKEKGGDVQQAAILAWPKRGTKYKIPDKKRTLTKLMFVFPHQKHLRSFGEPS